jgi:hypothetical protein
MRVEHEFRNVNDQGAHWLFDNPSDLCVQGSEGLRSASQRDVTLSLAPPDG